VQELLTNRAKTWQSSLDAIVKAETAAAAAEAAVQAGQDASVELAAAAEPAAKATAPPPAPMAGSDGETVYRTVDKFAWDQVCGDSCAGGVARAR
jgi:hypothetical protein